MNRRHFFGLLAAGLAAAADPERAVWLPGRKLISIPKPRRGYHVWISHSRGVAFDGELHLNEPKRCKDLAMDVVLVEAPGGWLSIRLQGIPDRQLHFQAVTMEWPAFVDPERPKPVREGDFWPTHFIARSGYGLRLRSGRLDRGQGMGAARQ